MRPLKINSNIYLIAIMLSLLAVCLIPTTAIATSEFDDLLDVRIADLSQHDVENRLIPACDRGHGPSCLAVSVWALLHDKKIMSVAFYIRSTGNVETRANKIAQYRILLNIIERLYGPCPCCKLKQ